MHETFKNVFIPDAALINIMSKKEGIIKFANSDSDSEGEETVVSNIKFASDSDTGVNSSTEDFSSLPLIGVHCENETSKDPPIALDETVEQNFCNKHCVANCGLKLASLSDNEKKHILSVFQGTIIEFKRKLLSHLQTQENIGIPATSICFFKQNFCIKAFSNLVERSEYLVRTVVEDKLTGTQRYMHGNYKSSRESGASINFTVWMLLFSRKYGQDSPEDVTIVLPAYLYKG